MKSYFLTFVRYNAWANKRLYDVVAQVPDAQYREDRRAYFRSLHGTLNHLLVGDRIWLARLAGEGNPPISLDEILYDDFAALRQAREAEDDKLIRTVDNFGDVQLAGKIAYHNLRDEPVVRSLVLVLAHVFNHQTHHRGQAHTLLTQIGYNAPDLDLVYLLRE
jgi:uncharacterized damage-inducible protein DinB